MRTRPSGRARTALVAAAVVSACALAVLTAAAPGVPYATADPAKFDPVPSAVIPARSGEEFIPIATDGPWSLEFLSGSVGAGMSETLRPDPPLPLFDDVVAAPEPASLALLSMGIVGLLLRRRA